MTRKSDAELLKLLCKKERRSANSIHKETVHECMGPGICKECEKVGGPIEPDSDTGYCEFCGANAVTSSLMLAGMI